MKNLIAALFVLFCASAAQADEFNAKVIAVLDGDTLLVLRDGAKVKIRMANIDAPEKDQAFGMQSRQSLVDMVLKKQVHINSQAVDQYGRVVGLVSLDGYSINEEQVKHGMAWEYSHFHSDKGYLALQKNAQQNRSGLWSQASPQAPWLWRKSHPAVKSAIPQVPAKHSAAAVVYDPICGHKKHCSQMSTCEEAYLYFTRCGESSLDGNRDGVPCESLCGVKN
jgi:endonuclease YncB( thermonuclease family)